MSLYVYIHIHQDENVVFDDIAKLNEELTNGGVSGLWLGVEDFAHLPSKTTFDGFVRQEDGHTEFSTETQEMIEEEGEDLL